MINKFIKRFGSYSWVGTSKSSGACSMGRSVGRFDYNNWRRVCADANGVNVALKENESDEEENDSENETVETISFKIVTPSQEIVLYAEKNMSWDDWMNSSTYNTIGVYMNAEVEYGFCYYSISNFEGDHYCYGMGKYDDGCSPTLSRWTYLDEGYAWTSVPDDGAILYYTSMP